MSIQQYNFESIFNDIVVNIIAPNLDTNSVLVLSQVNKRCKNIRDRMLASDNSTTNKIINKAIKDNKQDDLFKMFCDNVYPSIKHLEIKGSVDYSPNVSSEDIEKLMSRFSMATKVDIFRTKIDDKGLEALVKNCPNLEALNLSGCRAISTAGFQILANCSKLKKLVLRQANIDDEQLKNLLAANPQIEELDLSFCRYITSVGFQALGCCRKLKKLILWMAGQSIPPEPTSKSINEHVLQNLIASNSEIEELNLQNCRSIPSEGFKALANCKALKKINIGSCNIQDPELRNLIASNPRIEILELPYCMMITDKGFKALADCRLLKEVRLQGTSIGDAEFQSMIEYNPRIEIVDIRECQQITSEGLKALLGCKSLKKVHLPSGLNIDDELLVAIRASNPDIWIG